MKNQAIIVKTTRLQLRRLEPGDASFILRLVNEPSFLLNIGDKGVRDLKSARKFIREGTWTNQKRTGYEQFLIELIDERQPIGICGLLYRELHQLTDIGFALLPEYRGEGYAYEAAVAIKNYAHQKLGIAHIVGLTSPENHASIKLLEKLGLSFKKKIRLTDEDPGTALYAE